MHLDCDQGVLASLPARHNQKVIHMSTSEDIKNAQALVDKCNEDLNAATSKLRATKQGLGPIKMSPFKFIHVLRLKGLVGVTDKLVLIKALREASGMGLIEAKDIVDYAIDYE